jgi:predicted  nucleic acid-binding Zn-ribbon protein
MERNEAISEKETIKALRSELKEANRNLRTTERQAEKDKVLVTKQLARTEASLEKANEDVENCYCAMDDFDAELSVAKAELKDVTRQYAKAKKAIAKMTAAVEALSAVEGELPKIVQRALAKMQKALDDVQEVEQPEKAKRERKADKEAAPKKQRKETEEKLPKEKKEKTVKEKVAKVSIKSKDTKKFTLSKTEDFDDNDLSLDDEED